MAPYPPRYVSPKEAAENRARWRRFFVGIAIALPLAVILMLLGYSDQAPAALRDLVRWLDAALGYPVLGLLRAMAVTQ